MNNLLFVLSFVIYVRFNYVPELDRVSWYSLGDGFPSKKEAVTALRDTIQKMEASSTPVDTMALRAFKRELEEYSK